MLLSQHQGNVIDVADVMNTQHVGDRDIAERGDLLLGLLQINSFLKLIQAPEDWPFGRSRSRETNRSHGVPSRWFVWAWSFAHYCLFIDCTLTPQRQSQEPNSHGIRQRLNDPHASSTDEWLPKTPCSQYHPQYHQLQLNKHRPWHRQR